MRRKTILILLLVTAVLSLPTRGTQPASRRVEQSQKNCSYSIEIETTCAPSAETTDHISVRFGDSAGNSIIVKHLEDPQLVYAPKTVVKRPGSMYAGFGRCAIDKFQASGACMNGKVCSLYLKRVGSDEWRPGWVKVLQQDGGNAVPVSYTFYFRKFLPGNVWYGLDYCHSHGSVMSTHAASIDGRV